MSTETTKIQQLIDDQAKKQARDESTAFVDLVIDYLSRHRHHQSIDSGALRYGTSRCGSSQFENKSEILAAGDFAIPFKDSLIEFVSEWKKRRFEVLQSEMTTDLLKKVNLLTP